MKTAYFWKLFTFVLDHSSLGINHIIDNLLVKPRTVYGKLNCTLLDSPRLSLFSEVRGRLFRGRLL